MPHDPPSGRIRAVVRDPDPSFDVGRTLPPLLWEFDLSANDAMAPEAPLQTIQA
ncbi:MAG: hypothetical protein ACO3TN_01940 [Aquiluna sp.]